MGAILSALGAGFRSSLRTRDGTGRALRIGTALGITIGVAGYLLVTLA